MNIIIAGDGEVGFHLAEALVNSNHNITIVDPHEELLKMVESHSDLMTIVGESNSVGVLKQANVNKADLVISVLHDEQTNILTAILAKKLGAKTTIARVNTLGNLSEENQKIYEELGIDFLISPEDLAGEESDQDRERCACCRKDPHTNSLRNRSPRFQGSGYKPFPGHIHSNRRYSFPCR